MIAIRNVKKSYHEKDQVIKGINLTIQSGDIYGLIGHNGAGKSTLIRMIAGVLRISEGDILINHLSIKLHTLECKKILSYVPDHQEVYPFLTGIEYLNFIASIFKISQKEYQIALEKYASTFQLQRFLGNRISTYSKGMKQKLIIIGALLREPQALILDEPFSGLDPEAIYQFKRILQSLSESGVAILLSSHNLDVAENICNKIAILKAGKIVKDDETSNILKGSSLEDVFMEEARHE